METSLPDVETTGVETVPLTPELVSVSGVLSREKSFLPFCSPSFLKMENGMCQRHVGIRPEILARSRLPHQRLSLVRNVSSVGRDASFTEKITP